MNLVLLSTVLVAGGPAYSDVAPLLKRKCCACHRKGLSAPMALDSYAEASAWAEPIREAVEAKRMPPWHADPSIGRWGNDRSLSLEERGLLLAWLDAGCPEGRQVTSRSKEAPTAWRIKPDLVVPMEVQQSLPPAGTIPYRRVVGSVTFTEDVWVSAIEVRPGNRKAVHHILAFAAHPGGGLFVDRAFLAAFLPGDDPVIFPPGHAKRIPARTPILFQAHYVATGKPETDRSEIGFTLASGPVTKEVRSLAVENENFTILPGETDCRIEASAALHGGGELLSLTPHMHLRGRSFRCKAVKPGGRPIDLVSVPAYDFAWQETYRFAEPLQLPAGSRIECVAHYDNSAENKSNPDPSATVRRGEGTADEMMIAFVDYSLPLGAPVVNRSTETVPVRPLVSPSALPLTGEAASSWWPAVVGFSLLGLAVAMALRRRRVSSNP